MAAEVFQVGNRGIEQLKVLAHDGKVTQSANIPIADFRGFGPGEYRLKWGAPESGWKPQE
jgi:hypothetical protein